MPEETSVTYEKPLQTTNQVKANLINANMIKGDMILTKPGQGKSPQKVTFVQKQVPMKTNELKNIGLKKPVMISKGKFVNQVSTKIFTTKDGKLIQLPVTPKTMSSNTSVSQTSATLPQQSALQQAVLNVTTSLPVQQQSKTSVSVSSVSLKVKPGDIKREKRKYDAMEQSPKIEENLIKPENKISDSQYFVFYLLLI